MGASDSVFSKKELEDYRKVTYLTDNELHRCYVWFSRLARIDPNDNISVKTARINKRQLKILPHIENNPFVEHLFRVFASEANKMSLDDFINMISVFSDAAPVAIKSRYAFRVYDFESKGYLTKKNVNKLIQILIGANEMSDSDINKLVEKIFQEADIDHNQKITPDEFDHIVTKSADFSKTFCIRLD